jgi:hypothetical protein
MATLKSTYRFSTGEGVVESFVVNVDSTSLSLRYPVRSELPSWTELDHHQCAQCPIENSGAKHCPMAEALVDLQGFAGHLDSFKLLDVTVTTPEREIRTTVPAQRAFSSLMGLLIATCACPDVAWLRPMARFHLAMATEEETIYRATSMYMLAQYFRNKRGAAPDLVFEGLTERYRRLHTINVAMAERLRSSVDKDGSVNAVILLDLFAKAMPHSAADSVAELEHLFHSYLD